MTKSGQQTVNHRAPPLAAETEFVVTPPFLRLVLSSNLHELAVKNPLSGVPTETRGASTITPDRGRSALNGVDPVHTSVPHTGDWIHTPKIRNSNVTFSES